MEVAQLATTPPLQRNKGILGPGGARATGGTCAPVPRGVEGRAPGQVLANATRNCVFFGERIRCAARVKDLSKKSALPRTGKKRIFFDDGV